MQSYQFDYLVFISRLQLLHAGQRHILDKGLQIAKHVIPVLGSRDNPRTYHDPFLFEERKLMTEACYPTEVREKRLLICGAYDYPYNEAAWISGVENEVHEQILLRGDIPSQVKIGLIGFSKDESTYYLKKFPMWELVEVEPYTINGEILNATTFRDIYFDRSKPWGQRHMEMLPHVSGPVINYLTYFLHSEGYKEVVADKEFHEEYYKKWGKGKIYNTVDAVVTRGDEVLLVTRKNYPGKGLLAIPGGFLNSGEWTMQGAIRELMEEAVAGTTTAEELEKFIVDRDIFDNPRRSQRGHLLTTAYHFHLPRDFELVIEARDDAAHADWYKIRELKRSQMFEDHWHVIDNMVGIPEDY